MSAERDTTRIVRSWLRTDEHESADRVLDDVLALLTRPHSAAPDGRRGGSPTCTPTPSWRWWPPPWWSSPSSESTCCRPAAGSSASRLRRRRPSHRRRRRPVCCRPPLRACFPPAGILETGKRHAISLEGVPFTLTVPTPEWTSNGTFGIDRSGALGRSAQASSFGRTPRSASSRIRAPAKRSRTRRLPVRPRGGRRRGPRHDAGQRAYGRHRRRVPRQAGRHPDPGRHRLRRDELLPLVCAHGG